jgi:hypothetical protein
LGVMDIKSHAAGARDRHCVEEHIGNRRFRNGPKDARSLGPAGRGRRDIAESDVIPIGRRGGNRRRRVGCGRQSGGIPARKIKGVIDDIGHG